MSNVRAYIKGEMTYIGDENGIFLRESFLGNYVIQSNFSMSRTMWIPILLGLRVNTDHPTLNRSVLTGLRLVRDGQKKLCCNMDSKITI